MTNKKINNFFDIYQTSENVEDSVLINYNNKFLDEYLNEVSSSSDEEDN